MSLARIDNRSFSLTPKNLDEAMQYAKIICESDFCPKEHKGKPGNVLIAVQYGAELGLSPMQALQNVAIISGKPSVWGDALLALSMSHPSFEDIIETVKDGVATCRVKIKGREDVVKTFSVDDAKKAGLLGKPGPWTNYQSRMLQMRARGFALRDAFPDALKGLMAREEVEDYEVKPKLMRQNVDQVKPITFVQEVKVEEVIEEKDGTEDMEFKADIERLEKASSREELENAYKSAYKFWAEKRDKERLRKIIEIKDIRKSEFDEAEKETVQ